MEVVVPPHRLSNGVPQSSVLGLGLLFSWPTGPWEAKLISIYCGVIVNMWYCSERLAVAAYTVKLNRTNKECVQPYNPQAGSETPISLLSLVLSQAAVKDLQSLLSSTFLDNAHFGVKIVVTEEKPSLCSLHCIIASVSLHLYQSHFCKFVSQICVFMCHTVFFSSSS